MYKIFFVFILCIPLSLSASTDLEILKCSKETDNFTRLNCFDKISNIISNTNSIKINAQTEIIAQDSLNKINTLLEGVKKAEFTHALEILAYAKIDKNSSNKYELSQKFLTTINGKTVTEILSLAKNPLIIQASKENEKYFFETESSDKTNEKDILNIVINGETEDSYYSSLAKTIDHKNIRDEFMAAYNLLKGDHKTYYKKINGQTIGQVIDKANKLKQEHLDYIKNVHIYNIKAKYYSTYSDDKVPGVEFKLKNKGGKTLSDVTVTFYFKDKNGNVIAEDSFYPINVNSIYSQTEALKPNYIWRQERGKFYTSKKVPEEWKTGSVEAKVTKVEFLEKK